MFIYQKQAIGRTGSRGVPERGCDDDDDEEFIPERASNHKTGARDRENMQQYYTDKLEIFVETNCTG